MRMVRRLREGVWRFAGLYFGGRRWFCGPAGTFALNGLVNFLPVYGDRVRSVDPQAHFVSANIDHGDHNIVADNNAFVALA